MEPNYSALVGVVVMIESLGNNRGVVEHVSGDGQFVCVRMKTGELRGRTLQTGGGDAIPLQPPANADTRQERFVKVLDGPLQERVGVLTMVIECGNDESPQYEGVVRFPENGSVALPLPFLACWMVDVEG